VPFLAAFRMATEMIKELLLFDGKVRSITLSLTIQNYLLEDKHTFMREKKIEQRARSSFIMYYMLLYYPRFDSEAEKNIEAFREKYDPFVGSLKPHIPFIFPVPCNKVEETKLTEHIETVLRNWKPFPIQIRGFTKSWDHWLLLLLKKGNENAIALHDELYTGILSPYLRKDIEYIPHIGMGLFVKKTAEYNVLDPKKS
jgi:hypothetical protein